MKRELDWDFFIGSQGPGSGVGEGIGCEEIGCDE